MMETAIDQFAQLDLDTEEEIEVIYVESLAPAEIVDFARFGELQVLEELDRLDLVPRLFSAIDGRGNTALHVAAANGHLDIVNYILSLLKADNREYINQINEQGNTALHWASLNGHVEVVKALLAAGADHSIKNQADRLAFDEAIQRNSEVIMTAIADHASSLPSCNAAEETDDIQAE